jgi:hypothetical protein
VADVPVPTGIETDGGACVSLDPKYVSACFITKDPVYPASIIERVMAIGFGECLFLTHCPSPHLKQRLFEKASCDFLYYQDDDCLAPIPELLASAVPDRITCAMKPFHLQGYQNTRIALLGWGSIFPKRTITVLDQYRAVHGEDALFRRESERIMTWLSFPQQRLDLPIVDLPSAYAPDRLSMQPDHYSYIPIVEQRCADLVGVRADVR